MLYILRVQYNEASLQQHYRLSHMCGHQSLSDIHTLFFFSFSQQAIKLSHIFPQYQTVNIISCVYIELGHLLHVTTSFNFLSVTVLRAGLGHLQCTEHTIAEVYHRWACVSTAPLRVRGCFVFCFFCSNSWSWS